MKSLSSLPLISAVIALCVAPAYADHKPEHVKDPSPGNSKKTTRVDFDHDNNGGGNGDQDAPGNSGGNNSGGNNGGGNGDQDAPGNSGGNNNAENAIDQATQIELQRIESEALAKIVLQNEATKATKAAIPASTPANPSTTSVASNTVARRAK